MTITEALALFAALWASVLKRNGFRSKQVRYKTKTERIEELQEHQRNLLFFFLVGAERGEIEVWLASGATRRRSGFPCPLGRSRRGGPGRPRSSCRSDVRCLSGKLIHEHLWDRRTEPLSVRRGDVALHKEQISARQHGREHVSNLPRFGPPRGVIP